MASWFDQFGGDVASGGFTGSFSPLPLSTKTPTGTTAPSDRTVYTPEQLARIRSGSATTSQPLPAFQELGGQSGGGSMSATQIEAFIRNWQKSHPATADSMRQMVSALQQQGAGIAIPTHNQQRDPSDDKIVLPDGRVIDLISNVGGADSRWTLNYGNSLYDPSRKVLGANGQLVPYSNYLQSRGLPTYNYSSSGGGSTAGLPAGYQIGSFTGGGRFPLASVRGPGLMAPWETAFKAPDPNNILNDPAYKWRLGQGTQAIERSAASKGTLLTGGTLKDLNTFAQGLASEEYDKLYGRYAGEYDRAFDIYGINQTNQFNRLGSLANVGQTASNQLGQYGSSYGANAGNLITDIGAAQAGGQVGAANAWGGAFNSLGNIGSNLALYSILNRQGYGYPAGQTPPYFPWGTGPAGPSGSGYLGGDRYS